MRWFHGDRTNLRSPYLLSPPAPQAALQCDWSMSFIAPLNCTDRVYWEMAAGIAFRE